jgi:hypothetical protein
MNRYELDRLAELRRWQLQPPPPAARWFGKAAGPASQAVQTMIPTEVLRSAMNVVHGTAGRFTGHASVLKLAKVGRIEDLLDAELSLCDRLAGRVRRRAMATAGGTGALLGVAGAAGMVADVPALLVLAFNTIQRTALCYGQVLLGDSGRRLSLAIFALASANSVAEKEAALASARLNDDPTDAAWRDGIERAAERELAKEAATASLSNLALQASRHLGWRKAAGAMPFVGAVIGGSVNAWYLYDLGNVARYCFQERWLTARYGELPDSLQIERLPESIPHRPRRALKNHGSRTHRPEP